MFAGVSWVVADCVALGVAAATVVVVVAVAVAVAVVVAAVVTVADGEALVFESLDVHRTTA